MKRFGVAMVVACLLGAPLMAQVLPTVSSGLLVLHLDAGKDVVYDAGTGKVTSWMDQANDSLGIGGKFTVPGFGNAPTYVENVVNGKPVIRFAGGDKNVLRAESPNNGVTPNAGIENDNMLDWTFFFVLANMTDTRGLMDTAHNQHNPIRFLNSNRVANQNNDGGGVPVVLPSDTSNGVLFNVTHEGGRRGDTSNLLNERYWAGFINGGEYEGSTGNESNRRVKWYEPQFGVINGGDWITGNGSAESWFTGDIAEVIVFQGVLSDADRLAVEQYITAKYGIVMVPEPATMTLLALGGLAVLRRRR